MIFDTYDYEFLRLTGLCRYLPAGLRARYDSSVFSKRVAENLSLHGLIRSQSDMSGFRLTKKGRDVLLQMGDSFPEEGRTNVKKTSYRRKLRSAQWNVLLHLAGINVYHVNTHTLAETDCGYVSSLMLRSDTNMKVLAGTKFLGVLKIRDEAYIPYYIESAEDWIIPGYEREIYFSQLTAMQDIKRVKVIVTGPSLEKLWSYIYPVHVDKKFSHGMKPFGEGLKELGCDHLIVPCNRDGVLQMSLLKIGESRKHIVRALGGDTDTPARFSLSDGVIEDAPVISGIDFDIRRIVNALRQAEKENAGIIPRIICLATQKNTMLTLLAKFNCQKTRVVSVSKENVYTIFPELRENTAERREFRTKEGECIEVVERRVANISE